GFGVVYRAYQPAVDREVAIKAILPVHANDPEFVRRFEREAHFIARLEHPHIIPIHDYWRDPRGAYLVMRYLRGGNLLTSVQQNGPWRLRDAARLVEQIAFALNTAHQQGIVHQDLKPENILLDNEHNAYLSDFGIATDIISPPNDPPERYGSPGYASPEQILGQMITAQSDIYSFSLVIYAMLTGQPPFEASSTANLIQKTIHEQLPWVADKRPDLPREVDHVLRRAAAKNPKSRYANVLQLANEFVQCINHQVGDGELSSLDDEVVITTAPSTMPLREQVTSFLRIETQSLAELVRNPYKGLRAFDETDADDFYGREALVQALTQQLQRRGQYERFLAVVGASGSGKSSAVRAGLIPALRKGAVTGSERWFITMMTPGEHPLQDLEEALMRVAFDPPEISLSKAMRKNNSGLLNALKTLFPVDVSQVLLFIDQFEEVFSPAVSDEERNWFLNNLLHVLQQPTGQLQVVITLRADFYDRPLTFPGFGSFMRERTVVVLPLEDSELEQAIIQPAVKSNLMLDPGLVDQIVTEVREQPGGLPLLQFALTELYERREGVRLTNQAYDKIGGVSGALVRRADELYNSLTTSQKLLARQIFLRLITLGDGVEDTRRRVLQYDLLSIGDKRLGQEIIDLFGKYRLLTFDRDPVTRAPTVEIAHEALIRQWRKLRDWLESNRDHLRLQMRLNAATLEWLNARRDPSFLASGSRLVQFEGLLDQINVALTADERDYLQESVALRQRNIQRQRFFIASLIVTTLIALGLALFAVDRQNQALAERDRADQQAEISRSRELAMASVTDRTRLDERLRLSLEALASHDTREARSSLLSGLQSNPRLMAFLPGHSDKVRAVAVSPDGQWVATAGDDLSILLYDANTLKPVSEPLTGHTKPIWSLAFSPDNRLLASAGEDGTVRLWDVENGTQRALLEGHDGEVWSVAFSPDGHELASAGADRIVHLWDLTTQPPESSLLGGHTDTIWTVAFSPDGHYLASGDAAEAIRLWNLQDLEDVSVLEGQQNWVLTLDFSADSTLLASSGPDRDVVLWDVANRQELGKFSTGHTDWVRRVAFAPQGNVLATASQDNTVRLWDLTTIQLIGSPYSGHTDAVWDVAFSSAGDRLFSVSSDGSGMVWSATARQPLASALPAAAPVWDVAVSRNQQWLAAVGGQAGERTGAGVRLWQKAEDGQWTKAEDLEGFAGLVSSVAFSPDGRWLAAGSEDTTVHIWDIGDDTPQTGPVLRHSASVTAVAFSPDSQKMALADVDGMIMFYHPGQAWAAAAQQLPMQGSGVTSLAFQPGGQLLAVGDQNGRIVLWDVKTMQMVGEPLTGHSDQVETVAFSADGRLLASGGRDNTVRLWDVGAGAAQERPPLEFHTNWVTDVAFSPDGHFLASSSRDNTVVLWDLQEGAVVGGPFTGHSNWVSAVTFSPDNATLISGGWDSQVLVWDMRLQSWERLACAIVNPVREAEIDACSTE
ncbi:MAG: protein kinase, partial [Anaerolineae bacterium]|nr:protein kinase [Anaerolineae bacterium]